MQQLNERIENLLDRLDESLSKSNESPKRVIICINKSDRLMRRTIVELNKKCYWTRSTCQGHDLRKMQPTTIVLEGWIHFTGEPPASPEITRHPENEHGGKRTTLRWEIPDNLGDFKRMNREILEWARELPPICDRTDMNIQVFMDLGDGAPPISINEL